jgi:hypothetical protein
VRSSVSYNSDGGILNGDWSGGGTLELENVTVSGNSAYRIAGAVLNVAGSVSLVASTVASNNSPVPPAGVNGWGGSVSISNTILANPSRGDCGGSVSSGGYNIDTDGSCGLGSAGDLPNTDPRLRALGDNGGSTLTHALRHNSPAIDRIPAPACQVATDQRGASRPQPRAGACDIGAYEYSPAVDLRLLIDDVRATARLGTIPKAVEQALVEPLKAALLAYMTGDLGVARTELLAFAGLVMQLEFDGRLDEPTAARLLAATKRIHAMISAEAKAA